MQHMPVGRRLAFDAERGRLWVICTRCGEWNLTGLEERWEALEECERLFRAANVQVSEGHIGLAHTAGVQLIQAGGVQRNELANCRYGMRLRRRGQRARATMAAAAVLSPAGFGTALLAALYTNPLWAPLLIIGVAATVPLLAAYWRWADATDAPFPLVEPRRPRRVRPRDARGRSRRTRRKPGAWRLLLPLVFPSSVYRAPASPQAGLSIMIGSPNAVYTDERVLRLLHFYLPRLNRAGGDTAAVDAAVGIVDRAEAQAEKNVPSAPGVRPVWQEVAMSRWKTGTPLAHVDFVARLAAEMAVTEEMERRALAGEAAALQLPWQRAELIAGIADTLLIPPFITRWIERHRHAGRADRQGGGAHPLNG